MGSEKRYPSVVYRVRSPISKLGAEPGDLVLVEPGHPTHPVLVVQEHDASRLPVILEYFHCLRRVAVLDSDAAPRYEPSAAPAGRCPPLSLVR